MNIELTDIFAERVAAFSPTELEALRRIFSDPVYLKLLAVAECMKPSANCTNAGSQQRDAFSEGRANARLGEIRGWEMHLGALLAATSPKLRREPTSEEFQPVDPPDAPFVEQPETKK